MTDDGPVCFVTELPMAWCAHCRPKPPEPPGPEEPPKPRWSPDLISAIYHSRCPGCGEHIAPGDRIGHPEDDTTWVCEDCWT